jgi:hypothetical protein
LSKFNLITVFLQATTMTTTQMLERLTRSLLPPPFARAAKRVAVYPRYLAQAQACREGFRQFGDRYPQKVLFIAGLPKSGTTWLEQMISSYPGFHDLLIPDVAAYELARGGSHDYDLPRDMFARFKDMLVVTKMHVHGSAHNVALLHDAGVRYVVLYRDLRDVALSHYFYVRQTPWHPEYPTYIKVGVEDGLLTFADQLLPDFVAWIRSWSRNSDPKMGLVLRYEDMLADAERALTCIARHFDLDSSPEVIHRIVEAHRFQKLSAGRSQGQENQHSFFRKGIAGDWQNHFTPAIKERYKRQIGDFLIELGYEQDYSW